MIHYMGSGQWRVGLKPVEGRVEWIECLPFEELVRILSKLEKSVKRVPAKGVK